MVDPSILNTNAYKIIEKDLLDDINEGHEYIFKICIWTIKNRYQDCKLVDMIQLFEKSYESKSGNDDEREL